MAAPMFGPAGKPMFGVGGKPLICSEGEQCCAFCDLVAEFSAEAVGGYEIDFFDDSTSSATITEWEWDFGDGGTSALENPSHTFTTAGPHTVTLTVRDENGCEDTVEHIIEFIETECGECGGPSPFKIIVQLSGFGTPSSFCPTCNSCAFMNGVYELDRESACVFSGIFPKSTGVPTPTDDNNAMKVTYSYIEGVAGVNYDYDLRVGAADGSPPTYGAALAKGFGDEFTYGDCLEPVGDTKPPAAEIFANCNKAGTYEVLAIIPEITFT